MDAQLQEIVDRLDGVERGSPVWVNLAEAFIARATHSDAAADLEVVADEVVLRNLSPTAVEAFRYGVEQGETYGMELICPVVGYPDEAEEIVIVVRDALQAWREQKEGPPPDPVAAPDDENVSGTEVAAT